MQLFIAPRGTSANKLEQTTIEALFDFDFLILSIKSISEIPSQDHVLKRLTLKYDVIFIVSSINITGGDMLLLDVDMCRLEMRFILDT